jgi:hypothetical protein
MLAGVLLIVILIIFILQGSVGGAGNNLSDNVNDTTILSTINIVPTYTSCLLVSGTTGNIPTAGNNFPCCTLNQGAPNISSCTTMSTSGNCTGPAVVGLCAPSNITCNSGRFNRQSGRCA